MTDPKQLFHEMVWTTIGHGGGFEFVDADELDGGLRLTYTKNGHEAYVTASHREIQMNKDEEKMIRLAGSRVNNAVKTWNNSKNG